MAKLKLSAPWILLYRKIEAMFKQDSNIHVIFEDLDTTKKIKLYVEDPIKADALGRLLIKEAKYGDTTVLVEIIPSNPDNKPYYFSSRTRKSQYDQNNIEDVFMAAFSCNMTFRFIKTIEGIFTNPIHYVVFDKVVVQYFTDDIGDINGLCSTLYQEIAKDIFVPIEGVHYCTDANYFSRNNNNCVSYN